MKNLVKTSRDKNIVSIEWIKMQWVKYYKCDWKKRKYNHGETTWLLYWENAEISAIFFASFAIFLDLGSDFDRVRTCFGEGIMPKSVHLCQWRSHCRLFEERLDKNSVKSTQKHHHFVRFFFIYLILWTLDILIHEIR